MFTLQSYMSGLGIKTGIMHTAVTRWNELYKNSGSLSLASAVASEVARLVTLDMKSEVSGSERAEIINEGYKRVVADCRKICEFACASGGIVLKPYIKSGKIYVDYVRAENFVPCEFDECGNITGAAFLDRRHDGKKVYTKIEKHSMKNGFYTIENKVFVSNTETGLGKSISLSAFEGWKNISEKVRMTGIDRPLFAYFKMPMANCIDSASPLGVSVYARAEGLIADAQRQYERLLWEFESGERAIYVDETALLRVKDKTKLPDKRLYRMINSENELFEDWTPEIRDEAIMNGLNEILRRLEFTCGLAYGTLSDVQRMNRTAEEFRSSRQRSYAQVLDIQTSLKTALSGLVEAMDILAELYELTPGGGVSVSFEFDDSIAADRQTEFEEKLKLTEKGIMMPCELRAWYFGESKEAAKSALANNMPSDMRETEG